MHSIRRRLTWTLVSTHLLLLVAALLAAWWLVSGALRDAFDSGLLERARSLVTLVVQDGATVELEFSDELTPAYGHEVAPEYFQIWIKDKGVLERSTSLIRAEAKNLERRQGPLASPAHWNAALPDGRKGRYIGVEQPIHEYHEFDEETQTRASRQTVIAVVAVERDSLDSSLASVAIGLALLALAWMSASYLAVRWAVLRGISPVRELAARLSQIREPAQRAALEDEPVPEELKPIVRASSDMLSRIEEVLERERRFSGNVAHELRTPVTELRSTADVALLDPGDLEGLKRATQESQAIAMEMEATITTLLALWRRGVDATRPTSVSVSELLQNQLDVHGTTVERRHLTVERAGGADATVVVPRGALLLVLGNLVRNALEHCSPGSSVTWSSVANGAFVHCEIANAQSHLDPALAAHLTDPFWSDPAARQHSDHSGLGLSLVKAICEAHRWPLELAVSDGQFCARLAVPKECALPNGSKLDGPSSE